MEVDLSQKIKLQKARKRREALLALLMLSPFLIIFICFSVIPFLSGFVFSFMKYDPYVPTANKFIGFTNFKNLFNLDLGISKRFWSSFSTTLLFDIVTVPIMIIIPLTLAYFVNMHPPGYKFFRAIIYLPSVVSVTIMGIVFNYMFASNETGLINALLGKQIDWLGGKPWQGDTLRWVVMLIASIWWGTGGNFVIFSGALRDVPKSLYEACEMDGGGKWKKIMKVTFPNIKSSINICLFNTLIGYLSLYGQPYMLNTIENESIFVSPMMFIQYYLEGKLDFSSQTGYFCAVTLVFGLIVAVLSMIQRIVCAERRPNTKYSESCEHFSASRAALCSMATSSNFSMEGIDND